MSTLCNGFLEKGGAIYRCALPAGHPIPHFGAGARSITYASGRAPTISWVDTDPGANGQARHPEDVAR